MLAEDSISRSIEPILKPALSSPPLQPLRASAPITTEMIETQEETGQGAASGAAGIGPFEGEFFGLARGLVRTVFGFGLPLAMDTC